MGILMLNVTCLILHGNKNSESYDLYPLPAVIPSYTRSYQTAAAKQGWVRSVLGNVITVRDFGGPVEGSVSSEPNKPQCPQSVMRALCCLLDEMLNRDTFQSPCDIIFFLFVQANFNE